MSDAKLQIVIDTLNKASDDLKKLKTDISGVDKSAKKADTSTKGFGSQLKSIMGTAAVAAAGVAAVAVALKKVYEAAKEGAGLIQTEAAFESLMSTIGMGTDIIDEWGDAVNNTISDIELMTGFQTLAAGTSGEMTKAFADNNVELLKIAKSANALNPALGDTAFMYESITKGIKRASPMILDNLGIVVKVGEANEALADSLGKSVDELTAEEKQMAILNEVLESGGRLTEQLGGSADSATDDIARLETSFKNTKDAAKKLVAEGLAPLFKYLTKKAEADNAIEILNKQLNQLYDSGIIPETSTMLADMGFAYADDSEKVEILTRVMGMFEDQLFLIDQGLYNTNISAPEMADHVRDMNEEFGGDVWQGNITQNVIDFYIAQQDATTATGELKDATNDVNSAMATYNDTLLFTIASQGLSDEAAYDLAVSMGLVDQKTVYATEKTNDWRETLDYTGKDADLYAALVRGLADDLEGLPSDVPINVNMILNNTGEVDRYLAGLTRQVNVPVNVSISNVPAVPVASGGATSSGNPYLWQEYGYRGEMMIPSQNGYVLSRADAKRIVSDAVSANGGSKNGNTYNYYLTMPTSNSPSDLLMAYELLQAYGAQ